MKINSFITVSLFSSAFLFWACNNTNNTNRKTASENVTTVVIEKNNAESIKIGGQTWATANLNVSNFRNGDTIPEAKTVEEWVKAGEAAKPAWCYYNNDTANGKKYGKLYNWYVVNDKRSLAPNGWHVASDKEWAKLIDYLGGESVAGAKIKSAEGWKENGNGTNTSQFAALPGGYRFKNGVFNAIGYFGSWWSSSESYTYSAWFRSIRYDDGGIYRNNYGKQDGFSVRCIKD